MRREFKTVISNMERIGKRKILLYKLMGYLEVICDYDRGNNNIKRPIVHNWKDGSVIAVVCTQEQYDTFKELAERNYPKLCEFDVK